MDHYCCSKLLAQQCNMINKHIRPLGGMSDTSMQLHKRDLIEGEEWVQGPETLMPADLEVALVPYERGGPFPGLFLFTGPARMIRPVVQLPGGSSELIGTLEQINLHIRSPPLPDALYKVLLTVEYAKTPSIDTKHACNCHWRAPTKQKRHHAILPNYLPDTAVCNAIDNLKAVGVAIDGSSASLTELLVMHASLPNTAACLAQTIACTNPGTTQISLHGMAVNILPCQRKLQLS